MPANEQLMSLLREDQLRSNISEKRDRIEKFQRGIDVLRSSGNTDDPYIRERINHLAARIEEDKEAISTWQKILEALPIKT